MKDPIIGLLLLCILAGGISRAADSATSAAPTPGRPRLVDLGADKCIPCKMMAPILAELAKEYAGRLDVVFIDVWKNSDAGKQHGISIIPTQIFYDASGKERFRHEVFYSKQDTSTELVQRFLDWNEHSKGVTVVKSICGLLVIFRGGWLIYTTL